MVKINQRRKPAAVDEAAVDIVEIGPKVSMADLNMIKIQGNVLGGNDIRDGFGQGQGFNCRGLYRFGRGGNISRRFFFAKKFICGILTAVQ